jgi:hypothetical protein
LHDLSIHYLTCIYPFASLEMHVCVGDSLRGIFRLPIQVGYTTDFSVIQYAYDTLLVMEACPQRLYALEVILHTFAESTGLKVNHAKSSMFSININSDRLNHLASTFNYQARSFPCTYLSLPLSLHKPTIEDCLPLGSRVERRLVSTSNLLTLGANFS